MKKALVYFAAITFAETLTVISAPLWGIATHVIVLGTLIVHSALVNRMDQQRLLLSLAVVPLVRIVSLAMPLAGIPLIWWYPIIYAPLLVAAVAVVRILKLSAREIAFSFGSLGLQPVVVLAGPVIGVAEYFIIRPEPLVDEFSWQAIWLPAVILLFSTGFVEEFIFRGLLQHTAGEAFGWRGIVYVSLLFAILHMGFLSWFDVVFVFAVALFFSWMVKKTGSLLGVTLSHGLANITLLLVAPFFF